MTAALTGLPLLALLVACFVALPVLVALFIAAGRDLDGWVDLRDGDERRPGDLPCPATGGSHIAVSTALHDDLWRNVCEVCDEKWFSWRAAS